MAVLILTASRTIGTVGEERDPFDTFVHSVILVGVSYPFQTLFASTAMSMFGAKLPLWLCAIVGCIVAAIPASVLSPTISWVAGVMPTGEAIVETREEFFQNVSSRLHYVFLLFATLGTLFWMLLNYRWWVEHLQGARGTAEQDRQNEEAASADVAHLLRKLPVQKRGRLLALSAEQHYVRVRTEAGEDLVLMPFSEAIASLPNDLGMRIHRSHWVSRNAVDKVKAARSSLMVILENGTELPVSRSFSGAVRETWSDLIES
ncbi:LytTR family DNA-binding domain-containing protein [Roseivivax lentus]|uniref:LytTR family DNA-binding domain-containing protein n=1 Tax=Roseivivax lentus TaxID=633194 RepID=UPI00117A958F|nr:LytTR family DNA-binding domain-containing protein [Roseivivax lentus]